MGVRLALGATRQNVMSLIIWHGALLAGVGALLGVGAALAVTRYLQSFLFGVKADDAWTIGATILGLMAVALFASYIPARRAMRTDPMVALRYE
jgi:ABC-type lipoprotein release transport system permease subunit